MLYLDNKKIETKKVKELYEYLSSFDKYKPNSCFNEVGIKYNYRPVLESKVLEIENKQEHVSVNKENDFEVITDTSLVDKYLEHPILLESKECEHLYTYRINNLDLKPSVFDGKSKKITRSNDYTRIEISNRIIY